MFKNLFKRRDHGDLPQTVVTPVRTAKPAARKRAKRRDFALVYPDGNIITIVIDHNPKRPGTKAHAAFESYKSSLTVGDARALGVTYRQMDYDIQHNFIKVSK